jgi:hypothetical protein
MRKLLIAAAVLAVCACGEASAQGRYGSYSGGYSGGYTTSSSSTSFLYRGYNPGHILGNTVRRMYWGPSMGPGGR